MFVVYKKYEAVSLQVTSLPAEIFLELWFTLIGKLSKMEFLLQSKSRYSQLFNQMKFYPLEFKKKMK